MITIRDATPEDGELLADLEMRIFPDNCFNERTLSKEVERGGAYIGLVDEVPVGYCLFRTSPGLVDILRLGVLAHARHRGLGEALLALTMRKARSAMLTVLKTNDVAIRLYRKHGFVIAGSMPQHNSWVMRTSS